MATAWYCTRDAVKGALDSAETARNNYQVDRAISSGARTVEGLLHRRFYPWTGTRYFPWPNPGSRSPFRLWLDADELISLTTLVAGGITIPATDYFLEPANSGPPFTSIEIDLGSSAAFSSGATWQRAIAATGVFGHSADEEQVGALTADLAANLSATATVSWTTARIGVGDILRIDAERVIVTERTMVDTAQNLGNTLTASAGDVTVQVSNGTAFTAEEVLLVGAERMLVVEVAGNNLTVKRAWDGSVLAAHSSGVDVFALTGVELDRAQLGTTLAAHSNGAAIYRHLVPDLVRDLNVAEAINQLQQETSGYARVIGEGENAREGTGRSLFDLRRDAKAAYGRQARARAV
jgi:hypothetical protein